jgi:hypothetical protein
MVAGYGEEDTPEEDDEKQGRRCYSK